MVRDRMDEYRKISDGRDEEECQECQEFVEIKGLRDPLGFKRGKWGIYRVGLKKH